MGVKASEWLGLGIGYDQLLELTDKDVGKVSPPRAVPKRWADGRLWQC
jgi:hypothetical protein